MRELAAGIAVEAARQTLTRVFREGGIVTPALDARLLLMAACGVSHAELIRHPERVLTEDERTCLVACAARRLGGEPVSRILGSRAFWGLEFRVVPETLDPRPDTETLVEAVLAALPERDAPLRLLDLGTGTGCILIALLSECPGATGIGTDISQASLLNARENARRVGVASRAHFLQGEWLRGIGGSFDVVVSNPPYIARAELAGLSREVREHDPEAALDGGADGLDAYRAILGDIDRVLKPGGFAAFEVGRGQAAAVSAMMADAGLVPALPHGVAVVHDLAGIERAIVMQRPERGGMAKKELESRAIRASLI
ncbi:peptide chain release factor N(5)-glutamine methyltransferase [Dichotomicrobium thermohalophilum]|uniref:Release factor glutamine methyltransferase n=1 Tax=Dichotomicrobium thermohalophilum TaxID=933063 RepID=A0A397Q6R4_9HYPH|nr:peptide chain release factor N(5)-glutamine methyltransferase [Dichotomicrobium thermohalophilum]RIA55485.1 release factor glutamine methyltransferase [Dichotomicrobium thermohalophilum]